jgi:hypothetical protein
MSCRLRDASCPNLLFNVDASSFDVLLALQTLRIAIGRRKDMPLKLLFIVVPFYSREAAAQPLRRSSPWMAGDRKDYSVSSGPS